jgi:AraC-like DNA-binding protein
VEYKEHAPPACLAPIVHCLWTLEGHTSELADQVQPIVPDGRPELVMHFGDPFERIHRDGATEAQPPRLFAGQLTGPLALRPTGRIAVLGVRLHPFGAAALLRHPQHELVGLTVGLDAIAPPLFRSFDEIRDAAASPADAVQRTLARLADRSRGDARIEQTVRTIHRHRGGLSMEALATRVGITRRHLERRFKAIVGISPKRLARIARFQQALQILERAELLRKGAYAAAACGYADQAHFIRECQELCGRAPGAHLLKQAQLTGLFME